MTQATCPDAGHLQALLEDGLSGDETAEVVQHLETCAECQKTLEVLAGDRAVWDYVAQGLVENSRENVALRQLMEGLKSEPILPADDGDLSFLRPADRPGLLGLLGEYEVHEVIGRGGMGVVFKAFDPALHRLVAIKVMAAAVAFRALARQRFRREAQATAAVCHDHIVTVYGVAEMDGLPYLVMQYVQGASLQTWLDRAAPLALADVVRLGFQTASGLAAAHAQGLIHRDIKPANLLLENGLARVRITDFGLVRMIDDDAQLTQHGVVAGTPEYMAPEQARGEPVDHRADLFSLGSVLYALCTGRPPFGGPTALAVLRQVNDQPAAPLRALNPDVPEWLENLIARLMAKNPADRFQSAAEVAQLLEGYLAHLGQPATVPAPPLPPPPAGNFPQPKARTRFRTLLCAAALVLLAAGALTALRFFGAAAPDNSQAANESGGVTVRRLQGHTGSVHNVLFTNNGRLVSASGWPEGDKSVRVWDLATGRELHRINAPGQVQALDITPDGRFALAGLSGGMILYLNLETEQVIRPLVGHTGAVGYAAFASDGVHVRSASSDGTARWWLLADGKEVARFRVPGKRVRGAAVSPDSRRIITADDKGTLQIWDIETKQEVKRIDVEPAWIDSLSLTPDGKQALITGAGGVLLYDLGTGKLVRQYQEDREEVHQAALSPDGRLLITGGFDRQVRLWNFPTGEFLRVLGSHDNYVFGVGFSPDSRLAASGGGGEDHNGTFKAGTDHDIRVWTLSAEAVAPPQPSGGRAGWLVLGGVVLFVTGLSLCGAWFYVRHQRRVAAVLARLPEVDEPAPRRLPAPPVVAQCSACGKNLKVKAELAGRKVKCPQCGRAVAVPSIQTAASDGSP